jgi:hypothetical protein
MYLPGHRCFVNMYAVAASAAKEALTFRQTLPNGDRNAPRRMKYYWPRSDAAARTMNSATLNGS